MAVENKKTTRPLKITNVLEYSGGQVFVEGFLRRNPRFKNGIPEVTKPGIRILSPPISLFRKPCENMSERDFGDVLSRTLEILGNSERLARSDLPEIRELLREHNRLYYVESAPVISDAEYDRLFKLLSSLEGKFGDFDPSSPTNRIDVLLSRQFEKGEHRHPMISLDNTYDEADLADFEKRIRNIVKTEDSLEYDVELKFDGL